MPVHVENRPVLLLFLLLLGLLVMPQGPCPLCQRIRKTLVCPGMRRAGEKQFDIGIAVGTAASGHQGQHGSCVGAQIPGAGQPSHGQKQQSQNQSFYHCQVERQAARRGCGRYALDRRAKPC